MSDLAETRLHQNPSSHAIRCANGGRLIMRGVQMVVGGAMVLAAFGIWFAPGPDWEQAFVLMRLLVSTVTFLVGLAFLQVSMRPHAPRVEIDTIQHEVRLVRISGRDRMVLERCRFADLSKVINSGTHLQLWGKKGALLAEVAAADRVSHNSLVTALRLTGKL